MDLLVGYSQQLLGEQLRMHLLRSTSRELFRRRQTDMVQNAHLFYLDSVYRQFHHRHLLLYEAENGTKKFSESSYAIGRQYITNQVIIFKFANMT